MDPMDRIAHVGGGTLEPLQLLPILIALVAYQVRARSLSRRGRAVPLWRALCFATGAILIVASVVSPVSHLGEELILAHIIQHLAMGDIATLLMALGLTGPMLAPALRIAAVDKLRALAHPAVALPLWTLNLYVWHLPALYQGALTSPSLHALQHSCFVGFGFLMWMGLLGPLPKPAWFGNLARLGYIVVVRFAGVVLANVFQWSGTVFYPDYRPGQAFWDLAPLADQGTAGTIMMIEGSLLTFGLFAWLFLRAAQQATERDELLELADAHGLELDPARASRAVAAGRSAELRERLLGTRAEGADIA